MRSRPTAKAVPTKSQEGLSQYQKYKDHSTARREGFVSGFAPPQVLRASKEASAQSPFFGPISL